jgi:hypothetical protein
MPAYRCWIVTCPEKGEIIHRWILSLVKEAAQSLVAIGRSFAPCGTTPMQAATRATITILCSLALRIFTPMLSAVVCSGAGRGQGTAFEDFGEELGGGGEMFLVPGPYAPPQVGNADLKLVAVVAYGGVDEGALVGS